MARTRFALPVAGLNPADPELAPGEALALTARQRRELAGALRQAPQPAHVLRLVREGLQRGRAIPRILEDARAIGGLAVLRQYAVAAAPPDRASEPAGRADAPRDLARVARKAVPAPGR